MFTSGFNIIFGERKSGRTQLIFDLSKAFREIQYKTFFLGCTSEFKDTNILKFTFDDYRLIDKDDNYLTIKVAQEIISKRKFNFLFVDDIDYLSKKSIDIISSFNIAIIATSLSEKELKFFNYKKILLTNFYDDSNMTIKYELQTNEHKTSVENFINSLMREKKINSILNDKS